MLTESRRNDLIGAIAVAVLIIGTATGSGLAMLVMSLIALILIGVLFPKQLFHKELRSGAIVAMLVAAVTAALIGTIMLIR